MQEGRYEDYLRLQQESHESRCLRCGVCCGLINDPCVHLIKVNDKTYRCDVYDNRFGIHKTVKGNSFRCVAIKDLIKKHALPYGCAYMKGTDNEFPIEPIVASGHSPAFLEHPTDCPGSKKKVF